MSLRPEVKRNAIWTFIAVFVIVIIILAVK